MWADKMFFCLDFLLNSHRMSSFGKICVVPRRTYDSVIVLIRTFYSSGPEKDLL